MGLIYSYLFRKKFIVNNEVEGQDESAAEIFRLLGLMPTDVDLLYTVFWDIDADASGLIRPLELFSYFEVEGTKFEYGLFSLFDEDKSGMINFMEFVCTLWNLLTLPESDFGSVAYLLRDPSGESEITFFDVREIMEMMHSKRVDKDPALHDVYNRLKKEMGTRLSIRKFTDWTAAHPAVTSPILMLQLHIRQQIIGEPFWRRMSDERGLHPEQGKLDYVKRLQAAVIEKNLLFRNKALAVERERKRLIRLGLGAAGDRRGNTERRQSRLLSFFNLKHDEADAAHRRRNKNRGKGSLSRVFHDKDLLDSDDTNTNHNHKGSSSSSNSKKGAAGDNNNSKEEEEEDRAMEDKVKAKPTSSSGGRHSMKVISNSHSSKEETQSSSLSSKKDNKRHTTISAKSSSNSSPSSKTIAPKSSSSPVTVPDSPEQSEPPSRQGGGDNAVEDQQKAAAGVIAGRPRRSSLLRIKPVVVRDSKFNGDSANKDNNNNNKKNKKKKSKNNA